MKIYSQDKWLHYQPLDLYFIQGEKNVDDVQITIPKERNGIDLTALSWRISAISEEAGTEATQILSMKQSDHHVILTWKITEAFTAIAGRHFVTLQGVNGSGIIVIKFTGNPIQIKEHKQSGVSPPAADAIEQIRNQIQAEAGKIVEQAEKALNLFTQAQELLNRLQAEGSVLEKNVQQANNTLAILQNDTLPKILDAVQKAIEASKHPPIPGENGKWKLWDTQTGAYLQSDIPVPGYDERENQIHQFAAREEFPLNGDVSKLYLDQTANKIYRWDTATKQYVVVGSDYLQIKEINGGNANG